MAYVHVRGTDDPLAAHSTPDLGRFGEIVRVRGDQAVRLGATRGAESREVRVSGDEVVEVELEGGIRLWTSGERLQEILATSGEQPARGGELWLPPELRFGPPSRGPGRWILRALKLLKVDVAEQAAEAIADALEAKLQAEPGLYRCAAGVELTERVEDELPFPSGGPALVFLHGTASNTSGSFGGLVGLDGPSVGDRLHQRYGANVYALEHRTLSQSPIENALELVRRLPDGVELHLVSHSRGGLIGELLCRAPDTAGRDPFDGRALERFARDNHDGRRERDIRALRELNLLLKQKRPRVGRFVRVACPARGTTLASGRLDLYLSIMVNLVGLIPALRGNPIYEFLTSLTLAVAKKRTDPRELPGLEAQMPTSPLIAVLNDFSAPVRADLSVISGDTQGSGVLGRLKILATDLFYRENHDLVVNTGSMVGGAARAEGGRFWFDKGSDVSHFQYFRNSRTAEKLYDALARPEGGNAGFEPIEAHTSEELKSRAPTGEAPGSAIARPVVFVLPGIMGTHLEKEGARLWVEPSHLAAHGLEELSIDAEGIRARAPIQRGYAALTRYLAASHEVVEFPYDWRRSVLESADLLAAAVAERLENTGQPVHLLAHSMGGLVARAMIARRRDLWTSLVGRGGRLVMLGTPHGGSYAVLRMLQGDDRVMRQLALLAPGGDRDAALRHAVRFPGLREMLPPDLDPALLRTLVRGVALEPGSVPGRSASEMLEGARRLHDLLRDAVDERHMINVAGRAPATPAGAGVEGGGTDAERIRFVAITRGDGRVPWDSGHLPGVRTWYMDAAHGEMASDPTAFPAILDLLRSGTTSRLHAQPPAHPAEPAEPFLLPPDEVEIFPDGGDVEAAALGFEPGPGRRLASEPLEVRVVHGNLAFSPHPVAVGHYEGDVIAGAEQVLDRHLGGRLTVERQLGLYCGPIGTARVFLRSEGRPRGAIVVGLGPVGSLTGAQLERSFTQAALAYATKLMDQDTDDSGVPLRADITALLVGSGRGGIPIQDSVRAIVSGTLRAREALRAAGLESRVRIGSLEFLELYEDAAIHALRLLRGMERETRFGLNVRVAETLVVRTGGRRRAAFAEAGGWWDRLQVSAHPKGGLVFRSLTERARAPERMVPQQRIVLDSILREIINREQDDPALTRMLFELLLPNELKEYAPERSRMVLVVDKEAARYPWELLRDEMGAHEPLAVRLGLVRQLSTQRFRSQVSTPLTENVLVIGDPLTKRFRPLPGAEREAREVGALLERHGFAVTTSVRTDFLSILKALFAEPYRILHIAAHGVFEAPFVRDASVAGAPAQAARAKEVVKMTGMVLGDDVVLGPAEVEQMRNVPDLVFLNCCHLGRIEAEGERGAATDFPQLAANLATQLIEMGVRAVVAAGWAVRDDAAAVFAHAFYREMIAGKPFGDAVQTARKETHDRYPDDNTWGAYQCYGDPGYVLFRSAGVEYTPPARTDFSCPNELVLELANLAQDAEVTSQSGLEELRRRLDELRAAIPESWLSRPLVRAALARALSQVDQFDDAIHCYQCLLTADRAEYTVEALEQLANLQARRAVHRWKSLPPEHAATEAAVLAREIDNAIERLRGLPRGEAMSSERLALIGSAYKRLSQIQASPERIQSLRTAAEEYRAAHERAAGNGGVDTYPLHNWLAASLVAHFLDGDDLVEDLEELLALGDAANRVEEERDPSFWTGVARTEALLIRHLSRAALHDHVPDIVAGYRDAWRRGGSARYLRSVLEHLEWLIDVLSPHPSATSPGAASVPPPHQLVMTVRALQSIRASVRTFMDDPPPGSAI